MRNNEILDTVFFRSVFIALLNLDLVTDLDTDSVYFAVRLEARFLSAIALIMCTSSQQTSKKERRAVY